MWTRSTSGSTSHRREIPSPVAMATTTITASWKPKVSSRLITTETGSRARGNLIARINPRLVEIAPAPPMMVREVSPKAKTPTISQRMKLSTPRLTPSITPNTR